MDAALGALAAAVSAVESATEAAAAAASAAAAGFAAEMTETGIHPLEYGHAVEDEAGYETDDRRNEQAIDCDEPHREAPTEPLAPDMGRAAPSYQTSNQGGTPVNLRTHDGPADVHVRHVRTDQPRWHDVPDNREEIMNDSYALKAPLHIPFSSNPSPNRVTRIHTPLANEPPPTIGKQEENFQPESERRVSTRTKNKRNNLARIGAPLGTERSQIFDLDTGDSQFQKKSQSKSGEQQEDEIKDELLQALPPPNLSSTAIPDESLGEGRIGIEAKEEEKGTDLQGPRDLGGKRRRSGKSAILSTNNDGDEDDGSAGENLSTTDTPCRPRAAKLVAQRLCAPRKRHRPGSLRSRPLPGDDEQNDEDDADLETNENDAETDDEDAEDAEEDSDVEEELVLAHGTVETAISKVPEDMSTWKLVPGMLIKASILEECMMRHAQENHNEVLVAILALQTSQYWSYRCHCHGTAPKPAEGRARTKSKKCKCAWRLCFRVVNEKETLEAKFKASHPDDRRPAQIAVALLQVNSVHEEHTGHTPEPFIRGMGVKSSK